MKSLYYLTTLVALAAAAPSPAPVPIFDGIGRWWSNTFGEGRNSPEEQRRIAETRANPATSIQIRIFTEQFPRGRTYPIGVPTTTFFNADNQRPTQIQIVRGPQGRQVICYPLDRFGVIQEENAFSEGLNNAYVAPPSTPEVGYITCAFDGEGASEATLRFSLPGSTAQVREESVSVPGAARVNDEALQRATQVTMVSHPVPNTVCFLIQEVNGRSLVVGRVSIESRRPYQNPSGQPRIQYISCLPPAEDLQQQQQRRTT